ncbi:MAG: hypothetical protein P1S60_16735, partial [Anaerolineae bacterium]|nr:hypothetical protein [Anaerolineae bacterium]
LKPGAYAVVVVGVQAGGHLPVMTNLDSLSFDAGLSSGVLTNGGDNITLYDPGDNQYIQVVFNGDTEDIPPIDYPGFPGTAARVGTIENFGSDEAGKSLTRFPSGDTQVFVHDAAPGIDTPASPNSINVSDSTAIGVDPAALVIILAIYQLHMQLRKVNTPTYTDSG